MDQNEKSNLYRGSSINASYKVSYHLAKQLPSKSGENFVVGRRLMSAAQETQSMWEIRLLRGRLLCKGGGLTGMSEAAWPNDKSSTIKS
jgi:hypothetical protein